MKKCSVCGIEKDETEFYKRYAKCKKCFYEVIKQYRQTEAGKIARKKEVIAARLSGKKQIRQKRYEQTEKGKATNKKYDDKRYNSPENRKKYLAKRAVGYALSRGKLVRLPCWVCGEKDSQAHHPSYAEDMRLCVVWLCSNHHNEIHNPT